MTKKKKKRNYVPEGKYGKDPERKEYSYKYSRPEVTQGKRYGQFTLEKYQRPETMSDMQMHRAAMAHETSVINPKTLEDWEIKHFKDESGKVKSSGRRKKTGKKVAEGGYVKKYAHGGGVRKAKF